MKVKVVGIAIIIAVLLNSVPVWALSKNDSINPFNDIYCNAVLD